ncbi:uncharacterized protein LOC106462301 isoform X2 [Limulus polyphemus]|nr:uncharacterized protein LOC106462301 isoform X2 [Limulus polyphemus]XP_022245225.1 uncharacterized protein LOC106462301 isoform X2 [Limulus polyphemus]XP_022245226.1 uncharacterized protein LOC106462301 isoform X2 [Limulus polyphemus]XP_022245227.1 uncharacterized protein LOC106462301 isoform X2 [Limulus polyphemus]
MPVGYSASKFVYMEIERRLERVKNITHEPVLLKEEEDLLFKTFKPIFPMHLYRMKAVDTLIKLENCLKDADPTYQRFQGQDLCMSLLQAVHKGVLKNCDPKPIRQFVDLYQSARHAPKIFDQEQFSEYMKLLSFILNSICYPPKYHPKKWLGKVNPEDTDTSLEDFGEADLNGEAKSCLPISILRYSVNLYMKEHSIEHSVTFETSV